MRTIIGKHGDIKSKTKFAFIPNKVTDSKTNETVLIWLEFYTSVYRLFIFDNDKYHHALWILEKEYI